MEMLLWLCCKSLILSTHIHFFLDQLKELPPSLSIEQINPKAETDAYIEKIMAHKGKDRSEEDIAAVQKAQAPAPIGKARTLSEVPWPPPTLDTGTPRP